MYGETGNNTCCQKHEQDILKDLFALYESRKAIIMIQPLSEQIYSLICHQPPEKTFTLNGNSMPLCFRFRGIFPAFIIVLFASLFLISSSFGSQKTPSSEEYEIHIPPYSLIGVIVSRDTSSSIAVLKDKKTGTTRMLFIGEKIFDLTLTHIFENRIILQKDKKSFQIFLGKSNLISASLNSKKKPEEIISKDQKEDLLTSSPLNNYLTEKVFVRSEIEKRIEMEWPLIMKEARLAPSLINGKISGFKIVSLPKKGIISEIGIYKNDIIKEINGIELNNVDTLFTLYNKLKDNDKFEVIIERDGRKLHLLYILK